MLISEVLYFYNLAFKALGDPKTRCFQFRESSPEACTQSSQFVQHE